MTAPPEFKAQKCIITIDWSKLPDWPTQQEDLAQWERWYAEGGEAREKAMLLSSAAIERTRGAVSKRWVDL